MGDHGIPGGRAPGGPAADRSAASTSSATPRFRRASLHISEAEYRRVGGAPAPACPGRSARCPRRPAPQSPYASPATSGCGAPEGSRLCTWGCGRSRCCGSASSPLRTAGRTLMPCRPWASSWRFPPRHRPSATAPHLAARRVTRGREPDRVRVGRRALRFEWREVADVAPRLFEPPHGKHDDGTVMLHLHLTAEATPRPGIRVDSTGWVALWPRLPHRGPGRRDDPTRIG